MQRQLPGLRWKPSWVSHLGCIEGCLDYLGIAPSTAWLYGGTGHAFVLNIHQEGGPSGPTAWKAKPLFEHAPNLGYSVAGILAFSTQPEYGEKVAQAWEMTRNAITGGLPCYAWEMELPEYYVITGYNDLGYLYNGPPTPDHAGLKPWRSLGGGGTGVLECYRVLPGDPADPAVTVRAALEFAVAFARNPDEWLLPRYTGGPAAYSTWAETARAGNADDLGMRFNAAVWHQCRAYATEFLAEAAEVLPCVREHLLAASDAYRSVAVNLAELSRLYSFPRDRTTPEPDRVTAAVELLTSCRVREEYGISLLESLLAESF
ncbi:hypothetical protein JW905_05415 [bacterium]|nr:hypothetical protein [candidate division CSSED10-310 bacterium]